MVTVQMIAGIIFLLLSIGTFVISYLQFKEKGFLFNNAYVWASPEERKRMDENKEWSGIINVESENSPKYGKIKKEEGEGNDLRKEL